jgi:hypothetical protein
MAHTRVFFEFLETRFGQLADLVEPIINQRVLTSSRHLEPTHLKSLLQHEAGRRLVAYEQEPSVEHVSLDEFYVQHDLPEYST